VQHVDCHIVPHIGTVKLQKLTASQINALYAKLAESRRKYGKKGLAPQTIHHIHACLHKACKDGVRWGQLSRNPLDAADSPRAKGDGTREVHTWTKEQRKAFLNAVKDDRLSPLWYLSAMTGMRRGEAIGLRWIDVDLEAGRLSVRRALIPINREVVVSEPKTAKGRRVIAIDPGTVGILQAQAARQLLEQSEWDEAWIETGLVFTAENGARTRPRERQPLLPSR
jgi:integrase